MYELGDPQVNKWATGVDDSLHEDGIPQAMIINIFHFLVKMKNLRLRNLSLTFEVPRGYLEGLKQQLVMWLDVCRYRGSKNGRQIGLYLLLFQARILQPQ